jgi:hypothetical protein
MLWSAPVGAFLWTSLLILAALLAPALYAGSGYGPAVTTVQYDNTRRGWNQNEEMLTVDTVSPDTFGKLWTATLTGQIYSAPLYVSGVVIDGQPHNVVYVATEANLIYALDADNNGEQLWVNSSLGTPGSRSLQSCGNISPDIGITSTPVIDLDTGTLYAVGLTRQGVTQVFKMVAVDIATGQARLGWPVPIQPPATPTIDTRVTSQRGALLLANGLVYAGFGGLFGDCGPYHGWAVAANPNNPMGQQLYYRTPGTTTHRGSGIWAGGGMAADENYIYATTGNSFNAPGVDLSNAVLRLGFDLSFSGQPEDFFIPSNWRGLNATDSDLGSSTTLILPPQDGSNTPNMIFITGKAGVGHLLNRDNLGGVATGDGISREGIYSTLVFNGGSYSTAAYYEDPDQGPTVFLSGFGTQPVCPGAIIGVAAFSLGVQEDGSSFYDQRPLWCTPTIGISMSPLVTGVPGTTGIVWVVSINSNAALYAHNAATGDMLYNSNMVAGDALGNTRHSTNQRGNQYFTVIDGKVFIPTEPSRIVAYGLRNQERAK